MSYKVIANLFPSLQWMLNVSVYTFSSQKKKSTFHFDLWLAITLLHWICDVGRGFYALYVSETFPMSLPSIGDYGHMIYNVMIAFCILRLHRRSSSPVPQYIQVSIDGGFQMGYLN